MYLLFVQILGNAICDLTYKIIQEWGIPLSKVQFIITDNGSNMIKAFKSVQASRSVKCTVVDEDNVKEQELRIEGSQSMDEEEVEETEGEVTEDEDEGVEASAEEQERLMEEEINEFDGEEESHTTAFERRKLTRLSCFSHTLQLVVMSFNKDKSAKGLLSTAYKIVSSVSKSGKATEALVKAAGKKLVLHSVTRWTTAYLVVSRLLEVKEHLKRVLLEYNMTMLQPNEWDALSSVEKLLSTFAEFTYQHSWR